MGKRSAAAKTVDGVPLSVALERLAELRKSAAKNGTGISLRFSTDEPLPKRDSFASNGWQEIARSKAVRRRAKRKAK